MDSGDKSMELDNNNHSVFLLHYHLVLVIKYRRNVIDEVISNRLKEIFEYVSLRYNITLQEWNHDEDHVHVLFKAHPNSELSENRCYKGHMSITKRRYSAVRKRWKGSNVTWNDGPKRHWSCRRGFGRNLATDPKVL